MGRGQYHPPMWSAILLIFAGLLLLPARVAWALESAPPTSGHAKVTLVSEADSYVPGKPVRIGLRFRIETGWHIYWRNPGDAGIAPELNVTLPGGAQASEIQWPAPRRIPEGPVMTFGYTGEILLPVTVETPVDAGQLPIQATASWLVCERICVPEEGAFELNLPPGDGRLSAQSHLFAAADAQMPRPSPFSAQVAADGTLSVSGQGLSEAGVEDAWFFPATWGVIQQGAAQRLAATGDTLNLPLTPGPEFSASLPLRGVLELRDRSGVSYLEVEAARSGAKLASAASFFLLGVPSSSPSSAA